MQTRGYNDVPGFRLGRPYEGNDLGGTGTVKHGWKSSRPLAQGLRKSTVPTTEETRDLPSSISEALSIHDQVILTLAFSIKPIHLILLLSHTLHPNGKAPYLPCYHLCFSSFKSNLLFKLYQYTLFPLQRILRQYQKTEITSCFQLFHLFK